MNWILFVVFLYASPATITAEFRTQETCMVAAQKLLDQTRVLKPGVQVHAGCVRK